MSLDCSKYEDCLKAVKHDGKAIRFVENQTNELCLFAYLLLKRMALLLNMSKTKH
jgi:hypothetical protein